MRLVALLIIVLGVYLYLVRQSPVASVTEAVIASEAAPLTTGAKTTSATAPTSLKRPITRTHDVLDQVNARNGAGEF